MSKRVSARRAPARAPAPAPGQSLGAELSRALAVLLVAAPVGAALLAWRRPVDPFMLVKGTWVGLIVLGAASLAAAAAVVERRLVVPRPLLGGLVAGFAFALVAAAVSSETSALAVVGRYGRYGALAAYLAYLLLFLLAVRQLGARGRATWLLHTLLGALALLVLYGMLQVAGADPVQWLDNDLPQDFSTFGNVNFSSAWVGAVLPLNLWVALSVGRHIVWRLLAVALTVISAVYLVAASASQGPVVAVVGCAFLLLVWAGSRWGWRSRPTLMLVGAPLLLLAAALAVAGGRILPALQAQAAQSFVERGDFYRAALTVFSDDPLLGGGLESFANHFTRERPVGHAVSNGVAGTDAVHSVPLAMLADGGLLLALAYLALVVFVGVRLLQALRSTKGEERMVVAALGAVWLGYQAQSAISIDVPPLAVLHWVVAGTIVGAAHRNDFAVHASPQKRSARTRGSWGALPPPARAALGAVLLVGLLAMLPVTRPLRADVAAADAPDLGAKGDLRSAVERLDRAIELAPWEPSYRFFRARALEAARQTQAVDAAIDAAERDPGNNQYALYAAKLADSAGRQDLADRWFAEAVRRDPHNPEVLLAAAEHAAKSPDDAATGLALAERALELREDADALLVVGLARSGAGDAAGARLAYRRALELDPDNERARQELKRLRDAAS